MSEWPYIIAAYTVTWVILGGYALTLAIHARSTRKALARATAEATNA